MLYSVPAGLEHQSATMTVLDTSTPGSAAMRARERAGISGGVNASSATIGR
jgi:hypothetical protein